MFERYTDRARRALFFARWEASQFGSDFINPEHLLLALIREFGSRATGLFATSAIPLEGIRIELERQTAFRQKGNATQEIPFSDATRVVLDRAAVEADRLNDSQITTEHLVLGLLAEAESTASRVLNRYGLTLDRARSMSAPGITPRNSTTQRDADRQTSDAAPSKDSTAPSPSNSKCEQVPAQGGSKHLLMQPLMPRSQPFMVTEWDWFQIQLRVLYVELRGPKFVTTFQFRTEKDPDSFRGLQLGDEIQVVCYICCSTTSELVKKKESRDRQLEFYADWVKATKAKIEEIVQQFPTLRREFSVERNVAFLILDDYGMGSVEVCRFVGDKVIWLSDRIGKKANP